MFIVLSIVLFLLLVAFAVILTFLCLRCDPFDTTKIGQLFDPSKFWAKYFASH
nr:MAG TPA: hypothetical protein [Caudoviricetes sp.]